MPSRLTTASGLALVMALAVTTTALAESSDAAPSGGAAPAAADAAPAPAAPTASAWDPLEDLNRATFNFNAALAKNIGDPVTAAYQNTVPTAVQSGLDDFFTNLREPVTAISSGLDGDFHNAGMSAGRFVINSTVGILGIFDVATDMGWVSRPQDLGATLCAYGIHSGAYFIVPIFGPTTTRESVASLATFVALGATVAGDDTISYLIADRAVARLSTKASAAPAAPGSDAYAAQRDAYLAFRDQLCRGAIPAGDLKASPFGTVTRVKG